MTLVVLTNLATNPGMESSSGTVVVNTNYCTNPAAEVNTTGWTAEAGADWVRDTSSPISGTASFKHSLGGDAYTTATAASGDYWTLSLDYKTSGTVAGTPRITLAQVGGSGPTATTNLPLTQTSPGRYSVTVGPFVTGATSVQATVYAPTSGGVAWFDNVLLEKRPAADTYFSGATAASGDYTYAWTGTANASTSTRSAPNVVNCTTSNAASPHQSTAWASTGTKSLRIVPTGSSNDSFGAVAFTLVTGKTYTILAKIRLSSAQTGTLNGVARTLRVLHSGTTVTSTAAANAAGETWLSVTFTCTDAAQFQSIRLYNGASAGGGDVWWDSVIIIEGTYTGGYFDGDTASSLTVVYAWTGTANASTSTQSTFLPGLVLDTETDAPCPRTGITIDIAPASAKVNIWRTADGKRQAVRGGKNRQVAGTDFMTDYETPLGRDVSYELEILDGTYATITTAPVTTRIDSDTWWIQDPLVPSSAMALAVTRGDDTAPILAYAAVKNLKYRATTSIMQILGSSEPVALAGQRQIAGDVNLDMFTRMAEVTTQLRNLLQQTPLLLVRSNGARNDGMPALAYFITAEPVEQPVTVAFGGTLTTWKLDGDLVAAPSMNVLVPIWTYGAIDALWDTYQQAQTALAGKTYLDVLKSPTGA